MAKSHIIARHSTPLNLNTGKSLRTENLYADAGNLSFELSDDDMQALYDDSIATATDIMNSQIADARAQRAAKANAIAGKVAGAIPVVGTLFSAYDTLSGADASKYETALNSQPKSISIGNLDALADWKSSLQTLSNPTAKDLDTMTGAGKVSTALGAIGTATATGAQIGGIWGAAGGLAAGLGTTAYAMLQGKKKREKMAESLAVKNRLAEERNNAMFVHELRDILEEQANDAYANLEAHGGKIHIKPSKRGTFRAQAKRMGMSVQEAARHILANKNRYSPAMRKKAAFAKAAAGWKRDFGGELEGGPLFEFPVEYNHGGYFALDPELIKINQGGTHEQNPLDGVPMGFDENGIPNLVEEGETIFDDYVFSNRLAPTEKQLAEGGIATKYKDHTFADISAKIAKKYEETPTDPIAKESFREEMQRLKTIQELVREENRVPEADEYAQMPPQEVAPEGTEAIEQASMQGEMPMEEYPQDMMQPDASIYPEMMQAYGGNLFVGGGNMGDIIYDYATGEYKIADRAISTARKRASRKASKTYSDPAKRAAYEEQLFNEAMENLNAKLQEAATVNNPDYIEKANSKKQAQYDFLKSRGYNVSGTRDSWAFNTDRLSKEDKEEFNKISGSSEKTVLKTNTSSTDTTVGPSKPTSIEGRKTDGVAGRTVNAETGAGNSSARANTALFKEGTTAETKRQAWLETSGKALKDSLRGAKDSWSKLSGDELASEKRKYIDAMNAVQEAYVKAYQAGYDPTTRTSNKEAAVQALQELWEKNSGNKYFNDLIKYIDTKGNSGDNSARGWIDALWGDITSNRNWGLSEYFSGKNIGDYDSELAGLMKEMGLTYTPTLDYGKNGYKAYTFGLKDDIGAVPKVTPNEKIRQAAENYGLPSPEEQGIQRPEVTLTPDQERAKARADRQLARQERREQRELTRPDGYPTWMRYAPIVGSAIGAIWDAAQKPDYSVAEAAERIAANIPRVRFNPIGNYLTYKPVDRNYYLNQVRNQGLANERAILNASGANQGAATAALLANQYNTQNAIGNSLIQQELANRQNQQQVEQFNRGTDQYNSQGLFNESIYNQRAGMQAGHYALTAAQLRQAERQRRNAAISADLTNLFQGIGDIGWENMNINMVNAPGSLYNIDRRGRVSHVDNQVKCGGMLTKKKSKSRRK